MKNLIVYAHPNPKSFNHAIMETLSGELKSLGHEVRIRDLYEQNFDPVLKPSDFELIQAGKSATDVKVEQDHIAWADVISFVHPIWWTGLPAIFKGYIDRVFSFGFAFTINEAGAAGLLNGKKVLIINTTGTPEEMYAKSGMFNSMRQTSDDGIYRFCAMEVLKHVFFTAIPYITDAERAKMLEEVKGVAKMIS
ncbi:NAD(P)H-dependent oxidoreductase [Candidatus Magnetominusculus dajiuhuensis]|uniref:NAD(P)H-dependent oxidoreductase n=1 Tax=Candidatus Magnetominusculus dajiuhuensis TaxID=3137712 RepID=UPI003B4295AA